MGSGTKETDTVRGGAQPVQPEGVQKPARRRRRSWRRTLLPVIVLLVLLGTPPGYYYFCLYWPEGSGPAGPPVPREPFQKPWTQRPVLLVGLGDSITHGVGFGADPPKTYFRMLTANPPEDWPEMKGLTLSAVMPNLTSRNLAKSATTSKIALKEQLPLLEVQPPEVLGLVVITTGGNDVLHYRYTWASPSEGAMYGATSAQAQPWIANYEQRLKDIVDGLNQRFPGGCEVFLANIYDFTDGHGVPWVPFVKLEPFPDAMKVLAGYNAAISRVAGGRPNVHLVDLRGEFLGHGIHCRQFWEGHYRRDDPHFWYNRFFEDPNDRGYDAIRRLFLIEMAKVLGPAS